MENIPRSYLAELVARQKTNKVILAYLERDFDIAVCERTLKNWLRKYNIRRHDTNVTPLQVIEAIENERRGPRRNCGIRYLHFSLRNHHKLLVTREQIAEACSWLDPAVSRLRNRAPWERRLLYCPGRNYRWCIDGYDKLAQYGVFIHGCIDEYSRRLLWLEAHISNRLPDLIVRYFLRTVDRAAVCPEFVNSDFGREADMVANCQAYFYRDEPNPASHHRWNWSITNTTIEAYWRQHRQRSANYWIDRLTCLQERGLWDGNVVDQLAIWAVYLPLINADLKEAIDYHNGHRIRSQPDRLRPSGVPEDIYEFPERVNGRRCGRVLTSADLTAVCNHVGVQSLELPDALPLVCRDRFNMWLLCNQIHVTLDNADIIYAQCRSLFREIPIALLVNEVNSA